MDGVAVEKWVVNVGGGLLYALGAGMLFVMALNAAVLAIWPSPPFPLGGFPAHESVEECENAGGKWSGAPLAVEGGYCLTQEEQARNAQVDQYTLALRVAGVVAGAAALLAAMTFVRAGILVRLGLAAGAVMALAGVSGVPLIFMTVSSQASAYLVYAGSGPIPVVPWEAVVTVVAWLAVLAAGYTINRTR